LSLTFSPFTFTPPCSISRAASLVLGTRSACLSTLTIAVSLTVFSGMSCGSSRSRNMASKSASAFSAAPAE
jgi:hypothetical protein